MNTIIREVKYNLKLNFRSKGFIFWTIMFPVLLAIFYKIAFANLFIMEITSIEVGVEKGSKLIEIFETIDIIDIVELDSVDEMGDLNIAVGDDLSLYVKNQGMNATIVKSIVDQIVEMQELRIPIENYDFTIDYIVHRDSEVNPMIISFYSLIAMSTFYAAFSGTSTMANSSAEFSYVGIRKDVSSLRRLYFILPSMIGEIILNFVLNVLLLLFIQYSLNISLVTDWGYTIVILLIGNVFGASFGMVFGSLNIKNYLLKESIVRTFMLVMAALGGMMSPDVKILVDSKFPLVNILNPIGQVADNLFRVNTLGITSRLNEAFVILGVYTLVALAISSFLMRRVKHDSI